MREARGEQKRIWGNRARASTITVDCHELTTDEELALAGAVTEAMGGDGVALVKNGQIVVDTTPGHVVILDLVQRAVSDFISRRKDSRLYSIEAKGDTITVRSPDPVAAIHRKKPGLPPNLWKCPFCSFVTPYEESYTVHFRSHGVGA